MAKDEPYDLMPHKDIVELKKQLQKLRSEKFSSSELTNSMDALTKSMDSMLKLFKEASEELKTEEREDTVNKKLNEIMEQNKVIADGMVAISDMVKNFIANQKKPELIQAQPTLVQAQPGFQGQKLDFQQPQLPGLGSIPDEPLPELGQAPTPQQGPVAMPSVPFSSLDELPKPKKKGFFGLFKK